jgi:hypothetical protein
MIKSVRIVDWAIRIALAILLLQTLFFKFSGAEESKYIFSTLGVEPYGRIGVGIGEMIAALLILWQPAVWIGAFLTLGLMVGALGAHLLVLGIEVQGDGGLLFLLALALAAGACVLLYIRYTEWARLVASFFKR